MDDPADPRELRGDVYLAVGVDSVREAVERATAARASVVLVRGATPPGPEADSQVAVLLVDPEVSWGQLAGVVYGLVLEGRETESGRGPTDLFALADSLADALGSAVTIEDQLSRVLAYSSLQQGADRVRLETILGRRVPDQVRELFERRGVFAHLAVSDEPLFVEADPGHGLTGRMVVAVRAGRETLGSIWVECEEPLSDVRRTVLHDSSRTVGLHLLRSRASADLERQVESDLVIRLLEGTPDAAAVLSRLGLPPGRFRVVDHRVRLVAAGPEHAVQQHRLHRSARRGRRNRPRVDRRDPCRAARAGHGRGGNRRARVHRGAAREQAGIRRMPRAARRPPEAGRDLRVRRVLGRHPDPSPARRGGSGTSTGARPDRGSGPARRGQLDQLRRDPARVARDPGRAHRGRRTARRAPQHHPLPAAEDGRRDAAAARPARETAGDDHRTRCRRSAGLTDPDKPA
ncbi:hypothetical protein A4R44_07483 [Amycolatopsis sp. M39]|nr:hypothetical protein A4R44_07483 [Amycolatopsis sp. M39]